MDGTLHYHSLACMRFLRHLDLIQEEILLFSCYYFYLETNDNELKIFVGHKSDSQDNPPISRLTGREWAGSEKRLNEPL